MNRGGRGKSGIRGISPCIGIRLTGSLQFMEVPQTVDGQINFNDIFKKSFTEMSGFFVSSFRDMAIGMAISLLLGLFIFWMYKKTTRAVVYSHSFNVSLILLTMITCLVILTISSNVLLSLGMVGALSIVRFRTAIKDPFDVIFMFWAIAVGITAGAGFYTLATFGSAFIGAVVYLMTLQRSRVNVYLLVMRYEEEAADEVKQQIRKMKYALKSKIVKDKTTELTVELKLKGDNTAFVQKLSEINGMKDVSLVQYNGDYAA